MQVNATYMRGGTSKGVFFALNDLPPAAQVAGEYRDQLLLRVIGSPDPYGKHTDGMGGATSSTSKAVIVSKSKKKNHDVDYLFGQVSIDKPVVDWSGNCGNLTAAVGAFAIHNGLISSDRVPDDGIVDVRIWQANINKTIVVSVPVINRQVQELGRFELDGVTFPAAEIGVSFEEPVDGVLFPTGNLVDEMILPAGVIEGDKLKATMINAGIPTIFINAVDLGYTGCELQEDINSDSIALDRFEKIRAAGAVMMGLIEHVDQAAQRQHTPKIAIVGSSKTYISSSGKRILAEDIDLNVRAFSMGKLHHAMMGTAAVAIASAAAIPGTMVRRAMGEQTSNRVTFGHPSGVLNVGATADQHEGQWLVKQVTMSRSARILMQGQVFLPEV
jgi:probable AcnD-accessory protein PrpF